MVKIARIKSGSTHFATKVDESGRVTAWTETESDAVPVSEEVVEKVAKYYAGRENAGKFIFGNEKGKAARPFVEGPVKTPDQGPSAMTPKLAELAKSIEMDDCTDPDKIAAAAITELKALIVANENHHADGAKAEQEIAKLQADLAASDKLVKELQAKVK